MTRKIAFITDIHLEESFPAEHGVDTSRNWKKILDDVAKRGISEIIFGGDIGELNANRAFFESLNGFKINIILGNHDTFDEVTKYFGLALTVGNGELYYANEDGYFKYIFLDSSPGSVSDAQFNFLASSVDTNKSILLFIHHPVLGIDTPIDRKYPLQNRERIQHLLRGLSQKIFIFSGHYHICYKETVGQIQQIVNPAASYQIAREASSIEVSSDKSFGYRIIYFEKDMIETELVMFEDRQGAN